MRSPRRPRALPTRLLLALPLLGLASFTAGCSDRPEPKASPEARPEPAALLDAIEDPEHRILNLEVVEDLSEAVANRWLAFGEQLRRRRFDEARAFLAADFLGHDFTRLFETEPDRLPLGIGHRQRRLENPSDAPAVGRDEFLEAIERWLGDFAVLDRVHPKLKAAEFAAGEPWGACTVKTTVLGRASDGGPLGRVVWLRARVVERGGTWLVDRLRAVSIEEVHRPRPLFTDVAVSAGVAHLGPPFGKDGNDSFFWEGAASHDVDGDGDFDLFVPSDGRNFLYLNRADGTFEEAAERAGVARDGDGTGALFFDADGDGDPDLLVGQVGFVHRGETIGRTNQFFANESDDDVRFVDRTHEAGFDDGLHVSFSLAADDVDLDGDVDVYVASYNAEGFVGTNSWYQATNGTPNVLYLNDGRGVFRDGAEGAGVADRRWSYAAAFCDFDEDGDPDLYVANDYADNALFVNRGDGTFEDRAAELGVTDVGNGMGATWGDHDGDGDLDLYVANMSSTAGQRILKRLASGADPLERTLFKLAAGNSLFTWNGKTFERAPKALGADQASWAWGAQFLDMDLDGDLDLACVNGFISGESIEDT